MQRTKRKVSLRPSPAFLVAMTALVVAMSGAAVAASGVIESGDIKNRTIKGRDVARDALKGRHVKEGKLKDQHIKNETLTGSDIKDETLTGSDVKDETLTGKDVADGSLTDAELVNHAVLGAGGKSLVGLAATEGANPDAARNAAPATELFKKGQLTVYAKCYRDTTGDETFADIYIATAADGAVFDGDDALEGGNAGADFLNTNTAEADRALAETSATGSDAALDEGEFTAAAADGTHLIGQLTTAAKNGVLAGGNGVYGNGNVCLFGGEIAG